MNEKKFEATLKLIRHSRDRDALNSSMSKALALMLHRPCDASLLATLQSQFAKIVKSLPPEKSTSDSQEMRQAAIRSIVLLQAAKKRRMPYSVSDDQGFHPQPKHWVMLASAAAVLAILMMMGRS